MVDDSAVVRTALTRIINSDPQLEVIGTASDPYFAAQKIKKIIPDVITLDLEMPRMDGLTFLRKIMQQLPLPVVIISSLTQKGGEAAIKAMQYGAVEVITKPHMYDDKYLEEAKVTICDKIKAAAISKVSKKDQRRQEPQKKSRAATPITPQPKYNADVIIPQSARHNLQRTSETIVAIGASTGGTEAIASILQALPADAPGIVIVQHMPEMFTRSFAERLDSICKINVKEAQSGDSVLRGHALIAPGNKHTLIKSSGAKYFVEVREGPLVNRHRPSVDVLFRSAAKYAGKSAIGIILTGMGDDGARGMAEMKEAGSYTIAQDEKSSVVFGMPKEAIKMGVVDKTLSLEQIPASFANIKSGHQAT